MTADRPPNEGASKQLRLFVAIELPEATMRALIETTAALRRVAPDDAVRWVRPEGIHLTLQFLGATDEDRVPLIHTALRLAVRDIAPFDVAPAGVGSFGGRANLRVVWVGLGDDGGALAELADRVQTATEPLGYAREQRTFNAHLTLGRVREGASRDDRARLHDALARFDAPPIPSFHVERVSLMRSTLGRGGAVYEQLGAHPLAGVEA
ncbi:MAG: RNA 2',3'-cyclic phosphodiesterase [Dehalococcoidia bacterium]|nr:MAG: RNA 2',3'-cyclic phosphodiesterase [Dehalococcoidia bacterium]